MQFVRRHMLTLLLAAVLVPLTAFASAQAVELTEEERAYLASHGPFSFCVDPDWPPYEVIDANGTHHGIAADLLRLAAARSGVTLELMPTRDWDESVAASQQGHCQILSFLNQSPKRDSWLIFTAPVFIDRNVIVTREEHPYIDDLGAVTNASVALPKGTSIEERLRKDFPNLTVIITASEAEAFSLVSNRKATMTIRSLIVAVDTIKRDGWFNLKISGQIPGYENQLRIGIAKSHTMLRDILDKGVKDITLAERAEIANKHVAIKVNAWVDYQLIARIVAVFSIMVLTSTFWAFKLRKLNRRLKAASLTDSLTGLPNRACLNERMAKEADRFRRYNRPFSVVLLDLDYFKRVNDELGHLTGNSVLVKFAALALQVARTQDLVGRWGGEEFLVLCSETTAEQALVMTERLCRSVREYDFGLGRRQTISAGIAAMRADETIDDMLHRADQALYAAKNGGRDQVRAADRS